VWCFEHLYRTVPVWKGTTHKVAESPAFPPRVRLILQRLLRVVEVLHHEWEPSVAKQVGVADEEEFNLKFDGVPEFQILDRAGANKVPLSASAYLQRALQAANSEGRI